MLFEGSKGFFCRTMVLFLVAGIAIRLVLGALVTYNYDVFSWALIIANIQEGSGLYDVTGYNYPPVWGYFLAVLGQFTDLLGIDVLAERFPELIFNEEYAANNPHIAFTTTIGFNTLVSAMIAMFDVLVAYLIYYASREILHNERAGLVGAAFWMLCPFAILIGSVGPMFDSLSGALVILIMLLLVKDQEFLAGCLFALAVFLKLFPGFILFIFVAYIVVKHRDDFVKRVGFAAAGTLIVMGFILVPQIADGHLIDSFSFITNRATVENAGRGALDTFLPVLAYILALALEILAAFAFYRMRHEDLDRNFLFFVFIGAMITLLFPGAPQYVLIGAPLIVVMAFNIDRRYRVPLVMMIFGTSMYVLASGTATLTSLMEYTDLLSFETWYAADSWFIGTEVLGFNMFRVFAFVGSVIQHLAIFFTYYLILDNMGIIDRLRRRYEARRAGTGGC